MKRVIEINDGEDVSIYIGNQHIVDIDQVNDKKVINLFLILAHNTRFVKHENYGNENDPVKMEIMCDRT